MKVPEQPPKLNFNKNPKQLVDLFIKFREQQHTEKYLHWDKLRRYPAPKGFSHEEWWFALKMQRMNQYKTVPLTDKDSKPFNYLIVDQISEALHKIDQGAGGFIQMPEQITNPDMKDQYYVSSLIQEAITSSQLEGAVTTREIAKEMIRTGRPPRDRSEQMIVNNFITMRRIGKLKKEVMSRELVFEIHKIVTEKTLDNPSAAGRFRNQDEKIVISDMYNEVFHTPPPAEQLEERMATMCDFANGKTPEYFIHPVIRSIILHFWIAYDHPFVDGNGRTARALFYWSMSRYNYWLFEFISISQSILDAPVKYYRAFLYTETDDNDLTYFILYHLDVIKRSIEELHKYIKYKTEQLQALEIRIRGLSTLNYRQRALIGHALRHPHQRYTIKSHQTSHNIVYETSRSDLLHLESLGLLQGRKIGKTWYFTPEKNIERKLGDLA
jgi:Fic family protein